MLLPGLWLTDVALSSDEGFARAGELLSNPLLAPFWALAFASYIYHLGAGVRHLLMDLGIGEDLRSGRFSALLVLALGALSFLFALIVLLG